ncbi:unnamed protein product [Clonostachys rosea]|uniref:DUF676 domain-containing protein n=1 Tax=Bionectria ochroleuca TaxID=29856 RepID=A0ABY6UEP7_BIOOC|nr:unnamed protein product [Clonostachys rosea]
MCSIVAIHGLNGHRHRTWTADNNANWIKDFLCDDVPNTRILTWGYDSNIFPSNGINQLHLHDHATSLVADLCLLRRNTKASIASPLISTQALLYSHNATREVNKQHREMKISTYGIFFMGTPHLGSNVAQMALSFRRMASIFGNFDDKLVEHLTTFSEKLQELQSRYVSIAGCFVTRFAYESSPTQVFGNRRVFIVPLASAIAEGSSLDSERIVIYADHVQLVKYRAKNSTNYRNVVNHLQDMVPGAKQAIQSRWYEEDRITDGTVSSD